MIRYLIILSISIIFIGISCKSGREDRPAPGVYIIRNANNNVLIPERGNTTSDSAYYYFTSDNSSLHQYWFIDTVDAGNFVIHNLFTNKVFDSDKRYKSDTCLPLFQWYSWGGNNQQWQINYLNNDMVTIRSTYNQSYLLFKKDDTASAIFQCKMTLGWDSLFHLQKVDYNSLGQTFWCHKFNYSNYQEQLSGIEKLYTIDSIPYCKYLYAACDTGRVLLIHPEERLILRPEHLYYISSDKKELVLNSNSKSLLEESSITSIKNRSRKLELRTIPFGSSRQQVNICYKFFNQEDSYSYQAFWRDVELPNQSLIVLIKNTATTLLINRSVNIELGNNVIYPCEIEEGNYVIVKLQGNYTYNQLEYFSKFYFIDSIRSGELLGIDLDEMKQNLQVSSIYSNGELRVIDTLNKVLNRLTSIDIQPIQCRFKFLHDNMEAWRYSSCCYYRMER
ncbi:MAG: RICIN domain-containing protein [Saprospiraceae bacterium]|nr:RICIN domain-containing protein [Saprospiraceae bacterium]